MQYCNNTGCSTHARLPGSFHYLLRFRLQKVNSKNLIQRIGKMENQKL